MEEVEGAVERSGGLAPAYGGGGDD